MAFKHFASGKYRLKSVFTVYAGNKSETITKYSSEKTVWVKNMLYAVRRTDSVGLKVYSTVYLGVVQVSELDLGASL